MGPLFFFPSGRSKCDQGAGLSGCSGGAVLS
jgi:hypothetical protein